MLNILLNWTYTRKDYLDELFFNTNITDLIFVFICGYFSRIRFHYFLHEVNNASCVLGIHGFGLSCCLFNICGRKLTKFIAFHVYFHYLLKNGANTSRWVLNIATTWILFARERQSKILSLSLTAMSEQLKYIVDELNKEPFKRNYNLIRYKFHFFHDT